MQLSVDLTYEASPAEVHAMLTDPAFREKVCDAGGALSREVRVTPQGSGTLVVIDQVLPADGIPSFAQKIVGERINVVQTERWSGPDAADIDVSIPGKPGNLTGSIALVGTGTGTTERVGGDVRVSIPLVGGKLEKLILELLSSAMRTEETVGRAWLAGDR